MTARHRNPNLTQQMSPDIPCLCVDPENAPKAGTERGHGRPMAVQEVVVVF